jgi:OPA family glycerol-3-phosphate transporter-like MFS transporter
VQSLGWSGIVKITSRWFSPSRYGSVMGILSLSYLFGDALARKFMAELLAADVGWREVFVVDALVLLALCVVAFLVVRDFPGELEQRAERAAGAPRFDLRSLLLPLLRDRAFRIVCGLSVLLTLVRETFNTWTPLYFHDELGLSAAAAAETSALFPLFGGVSVLAAGFLSDALGASGRARIIVVGLAGSTATLLVLSLGGTSAPAAVALVAATAFLVLGPYSYLAGAIALDFGGTKAAGSAAGVIDGLGYLGGVLAGDTVARIAVGAGWSGAFGFLAAVSGLGTLLAASHLRTIRPGAIA